MIIRKATLEDVRAIVEVHTAGEDIGGSLLERYSSGGPWMSVETLAIHLNNLLLEGQVVAVAELDGKIVGEAEVLFSKEPIGGEIKRIAHVDVIEVHPDYRGIGVGRALVEFAEDMAKEKGAELITAQPERSAMGFYERLGFNATVFRGTVVSIPAVGDGQVSVSPFTWRDVETLELVAGRFQSSYSMFFSAFRDNMAGIHYTVESGRSGESYYVLRNLPGREGVVMLLWGRLEEARGVIGRARGLGYTRILTVLPDGKEGFGARKIGELKIVGKALTGGTL